MTAERIAEKLSFAVIKDGSIQDHPVPIGASEDLVRIVIGDADPGDEYRTALYRCRDGEVEIHAGYMPNGRTDSESSHSGAKLVMRALGWSDARPCQGGAGGNYWTVRPATPEGGDS